VDGPSVHRKIGVRNNIETINQILGHFSLSITQEEFDILLSIRKVEF
jgi:hypothetical protein